jgi:hypothetical protein
MLSKPKIQAPVKNWLRCLKENSSFANTKKVCDTFPNKYSVYETVEQLNLSEIMHLQYVLSVSFDVERCFPNTKMCWLKAAQFSSARFLQYVV